MLFKQSQRILRQGLVLSLIAPALFACSKSKFSATQTQPVGPVQQTYNPRPQPTYNPPPYTPPPAQAGYPTQPPPQSDCNEYTYPAPKYTGPKAVHVIVALDGSKSNVEERYKQLSGLVKSYASVVARNIPIKLALVTGHSPESPDSALRGNLFYENQVGPGGEPDVIVFNAGPNGNEQAYRWLYDKIIRMRTDNSTNPRGISGGGELLVLNTLAVLNNPRLAELMGINKGDVLNVHFLADENDACTIGEVPSDIPPASHVRPSEQGKMREIIARERHCLGDKLVYQIGQANLSASLGKSTLYSYDMKITEGGRGYSERFYNRIIQVATNLKVHMSAFVYTGQSPVPRVNENEIGRGYIDLIQALDQGSGGKVKGSVFDLASLGDLQNVYAAGAAVVEGMNESMYTSIQLKDTNGQAINTSNMDYQRTQVYVVNSAGQVSQPIEYRRSSRNGYIDVRRGCPIDQSYHLRVRYCRQRAGY